MLVLEDDVLDDPPPCAMGRVRHMEPVSTSRLPASQGSSAIATVSATIVENIATGRAGSARISAAASEGSTGQMSASPGSASGTFG